MNNNHNQNQVGRVSNVAPPNLFAELEETLDAKSAKKDVFMIYASTGEYVEAKDSKLVDIGIPGIFYVHRPIVGDGYVVSEGTTGLKIETGPNVDITLGRARSKIKAFIEKNGEEAFGKLLANSKKNVQPPTPVPVRENPTADASIKSPETTPEESVALNIHSAIESSLNHLNIIDLEYIADLLGLQEYEVEDLIRIGCLGFFDPEREVWETPEQYLSGNVGEKLKIAKEAAEMDARYDVNVEKLEDVIPKIIPGALIQYSLGAAWIPCSVFESFTFEIFKVKISVQYMESTGRFFCKLYSGMPTIQIKSTYAAGGKTGLEIFNATMNNQQMLITVDGKKHIENTTAAQSMQEQLQDEFHQFIMGNEKVMAELEPIYNERFNSFIEPVIRVPTMDFYPGASKDVHLREHQKKAIVRAMGESTLFAHVAGAGKTFSAIVTAMELKRLGLATKPMITVQNKTLPQFIEDFRLLYPNANILAPTGDELLGYNIPRIHQLIAEKDWDCIILPHSKFETIPDNLERQRKEIKYQIDAAEEILRRTNKVTSPSEHASAKRILKQYQRDLANVDMEESKRAKIRTDLRNIAGVESVINFEDMGIDALLIDEAHRYKRLGLVTALANVKGIDTAKSRRAHSAFMKVSWVQDQNEDRNTFFYTGTPISNTMAEVWTMMRFIRPKLLKRLGIDHFDQFAKTFGQIIPSLEQTGGGTFKIQNRFAKFQNLPELMTAFRSCADVVLEEDIKEFQNTDTIPKLKGGQITQKIVKRSKELADQIKEFRETLEWWEELEGAEKMENRHIPLVIFNKAKQAAIDLRLLDPTNKDCPDSKVNTVIREALMVYRETGKPQLIFCDLYRSPEPKDEFLDEDGMVPNPAYGQPRFNLFNDIKKKLIAQGVKEREIAIINEPKYDKPERLLELQAKVNAGVIKFLLGSTEKMGVGLNVQRKLIAIHHIDAPVRPMDYEQRNRRILRQGNENREVWIFTYGVEKTLDSAAFQRLSTKQRFINQIMRNANLERVTEDAADETQMTFDEMMAHLSDSPYALQKLLVDNRIKSERLKRDNFNAKRWQTERQLISAQEEIERLRRSYDRQIGAAQDIDKLFPDGKIDKVQIKGEEILESKAMTIDQYVESLIEIYRESPTLSSQGHFFLNEVRINVHIDNSERRSKKKDKMINVPVLRYNCKELGVYPTPDFNGNRVDSNSGFSLMMAINYQIESISSAPKSIQSKIEKTQVTYTELERTLGATFDETKLIALEQEMKGLEEKMLAEKNPIEDDVFVVE